MSANVCRSQAEAATVCLGRHHTSPTRLDVSFWESTDGQALQLEWPMPDDRARASWLNRDDATRDGAYAIVLSVLEVTRGLLPLSRTMTRSGADWWVVPADRLAADSHLNYEDAIRVEVSGMDRCRSEGALLGRLQDKTEQVRRGGDGPAMAGVVAFETRRVAFRSA